MHDFSLTMRQFIFEECTTAKPAAAIQTSQKQAGVERVVRITNNCFIHPIAKYKLMTTLIGLDTSCYNYITCRREINQFWPCSKDKYFVPRIYIVIQYVYSFEFLGGPIRSNLDLLASSLIYPESVSHSLILLFSTP